MFYAAVKRVSKLKSNKAIFAIEFAQKDANTAPISFGSYLKTLYWQPGQRIALNQNLGAHIAVTDDDIAWATKRLSSNKAIGIDKLKDTHLKLLLKYSEPVKEKIKRLITGWVNGLPIPEYFTVAKTFLLSKEDTPYPKVGNVRIIAVLPSILKLYEQILLKQLRLELKQTIPLHANQRGFVEGKCTMHNLADVIQVVN